MPNEEWTPADVTAMIATPFYAIELDHDLAVPHEPMISEDEWGQGQRSAHQ